MELTSENVHAIMLHCLFDRDEDTSNCVISKGPAIVAGFHPERLESHRDEVTSLLTQLPIAFRSVKDGGEDGASFLQMSFRQDETQWGEHINAQELVLLAQALGLLRCIVPRSMWFLFPGGMPYYVIV